MRKGLSLILALAMCLSLCACGEPTPTTDQPTSSQNQPISGVPQPSQPGGNDASISTDPSTPTQPSTSVPDTTVQASKGLEYSLLSDGTYAVRGIGSCGDLHIVVPETHEGIAVTAIGSGAFKGQRYLTGITLPDSITSIDIRAFEGCSRVTEFTIPASLTDLADGVLSDLTGLETIRVSEGNTDYYVENNCLIQRSSGKLIRAAKGAVIPADGSVKFIGRGAFEGAAWLTELIIPASVTMCDNSAFFDCYNLKTVVFEDGCTILEYSAFAGCSSLTNITLPSTLENIGSLVFANCTALTSITIPDGVKSIGNSFDGCAALASIYLPASLEIIYYTTTFMGTGPLDVIYSGTQAQWSSIFQPDASNDPLFANGTITVKCTDGTLVFEPDSAG